MGDLSGLARALIAGGLVIAGIGVVILLAGRIPGLGWFGKLPGDITVQRGPVTIFAPIATSIVLSILLTIVLNLIFRR